jgi:hypothetical protein
VIGVWDWVLRLGLGFKVGLVVDMYSVWHVCFGGLRYTACAAASDDAR